MPASQFLACGTGSLDMTIYCVGLSVGAEFKNGHLALSSIALAKDKKVVEQCSAVNEDRATAIDLCYRDVFPWIACTVQVYIRYDPYRG